MAIYNLGSINIDHVYAVQHLVEPGETLAAEQYRAGLGGKGANQSIAASRAGARVVHMGAVGADADWAIAKMVAAGVNVDAISRLDTPTGHAIIEVDPAGENAILLYPGANILQDRAKIETTLSGAGPGDTLLLQNETNAQVFAAQHAQARGMRVVYSAAPFSVEAVRAVAPYVSLLIMNEIEAAQLAAESDSDQEYLNISEVLVTRGSKGALWRNQRTGKTVEVAAFSVTPVDTTGAGDCFAGYVAAGLDSRLDISAAMRRASAAAALKVTRMGAADGIPTSAEVDAFLADYE